MESTLGGTTAYVIKRGPFDSPPEAVQAVAGEEGTWKIFLRTRTRHWLRVERY